MFGNVFSHLGPRILVLFSLFSGVLGDCGPPPVLKNARPFDPIKSTYKPHESVVYTCLPDYREDHTKPYMTFCSPDKGWKPLEEFCERGCEGPYATRFSIVEEFLPFYPVGTVVHHVCHRSAEHIPGRPKRPPITCLSDYTWSPVPVFCKGDCPNPVLPPHSSLRTGEAPPDTSPIGTVLRLQCIAGHEIISGTIPKMTCLDTNKWSELPTLCQGKRCPVPHIENGQIVSSDDLRLGEEITLGCQYGFRIIGGATRQCVLKSGRVDWNRELPVCERIPCARPPIIANGRYDPSPSDTYDAGWTVIYRCDADYSLIGNSTITCIVAENGVDGKWNLPSPECKNVKCRRPIIPNGNVASVFQATYTYQNKLPIECDPGYTFVGASLIECDADSQWKPSGPWCDKIPTTSKSPTPAVTPTPPISLTPGIVTPKEDGTEETAVPPTTTQATPKDEPGSVSRIGIAIGAVLAVIVLAALIIVAVKWFLRQGKTNIPSASTDNYRVVSEKDMALEEKEKEKV
ncbi:membrane cofactor protein-like isoform X4 [Pituophis catenifer annectens]|uniref:membrane cofactor protein-like isoform X4 n=1 Tax=Pituophis catenifer annectens TaxID=94852 RepID=UPI0039957D3A